MTERFAGRLARTFGGFDRTQAELPDWEDVQYEDHGHTEDHGDTDGNGQWHDEIDRFPVARHGYDRAAVDEHVATLEQQLSELRERGPSADAISAEIQKIGRQTAAILQVAHDQAHETRRDAQEEADRCLQDAAANALAITDEAHQRLRQLDSETEQIWGERGRLIDDVRAVAAALLTVADEAAARFPAEPEKAGAPVRAAAPPLAQPDAQPTVQWDAQPPPAEDVEDGFAGLA